MFETTAFDLRNLDREHAEIGRRYVGLEKVILRGGGMLRILAAADSLVQMMLLHFTHEEQFLLKLAVSRRIQEIQHDANVAVTAKLMSIEAELELGSTDGVLHLLRLGKDWMREHMNLEDEEFKRGELARDPKIFLVRRAFGDHPVARAGVNG